MSRVALIVGSTGLVGRSLTEKLTSTADDEGPWKIYGVARRLKPDWHNPNSYIQCNLLDESETSAKLSSLIDVTHIFCVVSIPQGSFTGKQQCEAAAGMLENVLNAILPNAKNLQHICLQTGSAHYRISSGVTETTELPDHPFHEDVPRLPGTNVYYALEGVLKEAVASKQGQVTWSVHRPSCVFGTSDRSYCNFVVTVAIYAAICKHENLPFIFPGVQGVAWDGLRDASDADLVAEQQIWAAKDPRGKNQAFNCTNGDLFTWKRLWKLLGEKYGMEAVPPTYPPFDWNELLQHKQEVWDQIVKKHSLRPISMHEVGQFAMMKMYMSADGSKHVSSMNKSKECGFLGFRNSERSFLSHLDQLRENRIIP